MDLVNDAVFLAAMSLQEDAPSTVVLIQHDEVKRTFIAAGVPGAVWEAECAMETPGARHAVMVVPVTLREAELPEEMLHIVAVDLDWGIDVHRCMVGRGGDDEVMVGPVERFTGQLQLHPATPGYVLIQAMRAYREVQDAAS